MILATLSSSSVSWWIWEALISLAAGAGGVLVFWGLWMEGAPDEKELPNIDAFRRHKLKAKRGWNILMIGIFLEIVVAVVFAARDGWQARQTAIDIAKNDPLNLPVSDISARMVVKLKGTNFIEGSRLNTRFVVRGSLVNLGGGGKALLQSMVKPGDTYGFFSVTNMGGGLAWKVNGDIVNILTPLGYGTSQFGTLESDGFSRVAYNNENNHGYVMYFRTPADDSLREFENFTTRRPTTAEVINHAKWLDIWCFFIPKNAEVLGGSAEIIINGAFHIEFQIFPKNGETAINPSDAGFALVATNATLRTSSLMPTTMVIKNGKMTPSDNVIHTKVQALP